MIKVRSFSTKELLVKFVNDNVCTSDIISITFGDGEWQLFYKL